MKLDDIKKAYKDNIIDELTEEGEKIIISAFDKANFNKNRTQNLHDSYGSAVYVNGNIVLKSIRTMESKAKVMKKWYNTYKFGENEIIDYLTSLKPSNKGITIVVAAAMPYASVLENGTGLKRKYKVISGARTDLEELADKYNGTLTQIAR